jgi:hypothetical protein
MGFKLGAFLGGLSTTVAERVKEQENRVNLLTDKALDLGTQVYLQKKKETEADAKKIEQGMAALAMTGLDTPTRFQIASGGATAVTNALNQYNTLLEKNKDADFSTFYSVKNSDDYADMDDAEFLSLFGPKATYDPSIARKYLEGRQADGLGGLFVSDPTALLTEFEQKAGVATDSRVETDLPALGQLSVDYAAMRTALGKKDETLFDTPKEAQTYYTGKILEEQNKPEAERDADKITMYEGYVTAYGNIGKEAGEFDIDKRLDAIANERYKLQQAEVVDTVALAALEAEEKVYLESKAKRTPDKDKTVQTLDTMIDNAETKLATALLDEAAPDVIAKLEADVNKLYKRKKIRLEQTAVTPEAKDPFSAPQAQTYIANMERNMLTGFDFVDTTTFEDRMVINFGGEGVKQGNYIKFFGVMDSIDSNLTARKEEFKSNNFNSEYNNFNGKYQMYVSSYISEFKDATKYANINKTFNSQADAEAAANAGDLNAGDIIRYKKPNGKTGIVVWTGKTWR